MAKGLDDRIKTLLDSLGHSSLYPPQELALAKGVLEGKSLLINTPTASGKSLIAMMAAIKAIENGLKVAYLTPLRALATEKYHDYRVLENLEVFNKKIKVKMANSDYHYSDKGLADADIVILTNEKMDSIMRHGANWISEVGLFIADEVHLIREPERGPTLEMILTRIRRLYPQIQVIALSATVANGDEIASWLRCDLIESNWRPTELVEGVYEDGKIRMSDGNQIKITNSQGQSSAIIDVAMDSLLNGGQTLVFAETRKRTSSLATRAADMVYRHLDKKTRQLALKVSAQILSKGEDTEITRSLSRLISKGVSFHHAGIGPATREIVEESFKKGITKLLFATPTLAAGVNLPARRVILASVLRYNSDYGGNTPISVLEYKQICGRAGRPKYDVKGEAIIVAGPGISPDDIYTHYILGTPEPLRSQLAHDRAIRIHVLGTVVTVPGMEQSEIHELFENTLLGQYFRRSTISLKVNAALDYLEDENLIKSKKNRYIVTEFGKKIALLYLDPSTGVEFRKAIESTEIENDKNSSTHTLGLIHMITNCSDFYPKLSLRRDDFEMIGDIIRRHETELFYEFNEHDCSRSLWALYEWINEASDRKLSETLGVEPGDMYRIAEISDWLAYSLYEVAKICKRNALLQEIYDLRTRIKYGIREELLQLVKLKGIGRARARSLYDSGITDLRQVVQVPESRLAAVPKIGVGVARVLKSSLQGYKES